MPRQAPGRGIDTLILLDRAVDMVTPCCTQLTYEGLIDEVFGIVNGAVQLDPGANREPCTLLRVSAGAAAHVLVLSGVSLVCISDGAGLVGFAHTASFEQTPTFDRCGACLV